MSQSRKGRMNYRCPICFQKEIDIDLFYDPQTDQYYCVRCPYEGPEAEIIMINNVTKLKFKARLKRITCFE